MALKTVADDIRKRVLHSQLPDDERLKMADDLLFLGDEVLSLSAKLFDRAYLDGLNSGMFCRGPMI